MSAKIVAILVGLTFAGVAHAESLGAKPATRIDFNQMIEDNNSDRDQLHKSVNTRAEQDPVQEKAPVADEKKVMDLVDVEVGVGESRPVVDRRFNSVGEARLYHPEMSLKVVSKAKLKADAGS